MIFACSVVSGVLSVVKSFGFPIFVSLKVCYSHLQITKTVLSLRSRQEGGIDVRMRKNVKNRTLKSAAIAVTVDVRKGNVHRHGAELAAPRFIVKAISDLRPR